ncbi:MAG: hypothetical protein AAGA48_17560 [Myxococcota bacterium]
MLLWMAGLAFAKPCTTGELEQHVNRALDTIVVKQPIDEFKQRLDRTTTRAMKTFDCVRGTLDEGLAARYHTMMGIRARVLLGEGDLAVLQAFRAARRDRSFELIIGEHWPQGHWLRKLFSDAQFEPPANRETIRLPTFGNVFVDGVRQFRSYEALPPPVIAQYQKGGGMTTVYVGPNEPFPFRDEGPHLVLQGYVGTSVSLNESVITGEPEDKTSVDFEVGVGFEFRQAWARVLFGPGFLTSGQYLFSGSDGNQSVSTNFGVSGAAGVRLTEATRIGVGGGFLYPGRATTQGIVGLDLNNGLSFELRPGATFVFGSPNPAIALRAGYRFGVGLKPQDG